MATPRRIRTGREDLETLREQRDRMRSTMRVLRDIDSTLGGLPKTFGESTPSGALKEKPSDYDGSFSSEYYKTYKTLHAKMGEYIGSSMNPRGRVSDVISPSIARNQQTGERIKPFADIKTTGPEYEYEQKYMKAPKAAAYTAGLKFDKVNAPLSRAQAFGSELAVMRRESSKLVAQSIEAMATRLAAHGEIKQSQLPEFRASFVKKLQLEAPYAVRDVATGQEVERKGLGNMGLTRSDLRRIGGEVYDTKPRAAFNTAVNPSGPAKPTRRPLTKSPIEPRTQQGTQGIPDVFKKAWGTGGGGLASVAFAGPAALSGGENPGGDISDWKTTQSVMGVSRPTFTARNVLSSMRNPAFSPEQRYTIWQRFGPKRFR